MFNRSYFYNISNDFNIKRILFPRTTVIVILLLTGPLSLDTASLIVRPLIDSPLMPIIKSPGCMPAFAAGVSSIGETTFTKPLPS